MAKTDSKQNPSPNDGWVGLYEEEKQGFSSTLVEVAETALVGLSSSHTDSYKTLSGPL
jgi:hypothetical protein